MGTPDPTTANDPITAAGSTQEITMNGPVAKGNVAIDIFKAGVANALSSVVSDGNGDFVSGALATGGQAFNGFIQGIALNGQGQPDPAYRATFVFPPTPLQTNITNVPVLMVSAQLFGQLQIVTGPQNDAANGALFVAITDCAGTPVPASLSVKRGENEVGTQFDLSLLSPQAAGLFFVMNVPAGDVDVGASFDNKTFRTHTVTSFKNENGREAGAITTTVVRPGP
ncbi:MAG: hypothetical protein KIT31_07775 [Deltaproteobacteria bacterium]|nr:hypothetical protein [Deltaproteobacteria bacterium]